jgi:hypothetical protein
MAVLQIGQPLSATNDKCELRKQRQVPVEAVAGVVVASLGGENMAKRSGSHTLVKSIQGKDKHSDKDEKAYRALAFVSRKLDFKVHWLEFPTWISKKPSQQGE